MPQPAEVTDAAESLIRLYREAHDSLMAKLGEALADDRRWRESARLRRLIAANTDVANELRTGTRAWLSTTLPQVHALGAAGAVADGFDFVWSMPHREAAQSLATRTWDDVAAHLRDMDTGGRRAIRELARTSARDIVLEGRTAAQSGRDLARWAADQGIGSVTYRNGAVHTIADYADTMARTVSATAYNDGTFTQLGQDGIEWVEVFDGPDCGWTSHDDPDKANGTVRPIGDAIENSLSHPRCARSFSGRPDIVSQSAADRAKRTGGEGQALAAAEEDARAKAAPVTLSGNARGGRAARVPRTART